MACGTPWVPDVSNIHSAYSGADHPKMNGEILLDDLGGNDGAVQTFMIDLPKKQQRSLFRQDGIIIIIEVTEREETQRIKKSDVAPQDFDSSSQAPPVISKSSACFSLLFPIFFLWLALFFTLSSFALLLLLLYQRQIVVFYVVL